jgi:L-ascorbate metabolism protein UlaG (beta-lactamase superfamily)
MQTNIFHTVNAGLYLWDGHSGLLIDGIHDGIEQGFSPMPPFLTKNLNRKTGIFSHVDGLLFTHYHPDHYQPGGVHRLMCAANSPALCGPGLLQYCTKIDYIHSDMYRIELAGSKIFAKRTIHDGERFINDPHQSYLIQNQSDSIFIAGDARLSPADAEAFRMVHDGPVACGFFNLFQLASPEGHAFMNILKPERVFLYHLPFKENDRFHYRSLARQVAHNKPASLPAAEILPHMQWIDHKPAAWKSMPQNRQNDSSGQTISQL